MKPKVPRATRWSEDDARRVIEEWRTSGWGLKDYAAKIGTTEQRLAYWRDRLAAWSPPKVIERKPLQLVAAAVSAVEEHDEAAGEARIIVRAGGVLFAIEGATPSFFAELLRELR